MQEQYLSPYQAASQLGISVHTVRRWCTDFASHLSPSASPVRGATRRLSIADVEVLQEVKRLRDTEGLTTAQIHERLAGVVFQAPITEARSAAQAGQGEAIAPIAMIVEAMRSATAPLEARLQALEQHQEAADRRNRPTWGDVVWIGVALFIAGAIMASAWTWFQ